MATGHFEEHLESSNREESDLDIPTLQEDVFSLNSSSLCLIEAAQANSKAKATELDKTGILAHLHHASPLESITELAEVEDTSEHRSPGDGEIRIKEMDETTAARRASLSTDGRCDTLNSAGLEVHHMDPTAHLESPMMDTCFHVPEIQDDAPCLRINSLTPDRKDGPHLKGSNSCSGVLDVPLDSPRSVTPQHDLQELTEEHLCLKNSADHEATLGSESDVKPKTRCQSENKEAEQNLIEILTTCEAKVEQPQQLRSSSSHLSDQLHSARSLATRLDHRVLYLEHQCHLKDKELHELAVLLEKTKEALRARDSEMSSITDEVQRLRLELEVKNMPTSARTVSGNGQVATNSHLNHSSSRVCALL